MNITSIKSSLLKKLQNRRYRDAFADAHVGNRIAMQLRAMRRSRNNLSQGELAQKLRMKQPRVSVMENPDYQNYSIKTLKRIATYYDVILDVRFISFQKFFDEVFSQSSEDLAPPSFGGVSALAIPPVQAITGGDQEPSSLAKLIPIRPRSR